MKRNRNVAAVVAAALVAVSMLAVTAPAVSATDLGDEFVSLVNRERVNHGLKPLPRAGWDAGGWAVGDIFTVHPESATVGGAVATHAARRVGRIFGSSDPTVYNRSSLMASNVDAIRVNGARCVGGKFTVDVHLTASTRAMFDAEPVWHEARPLVVTDADGTSCTGQASPPPGPDRPGVQPTTDACPTAVTPAHGFTDVAAGSHLDAAVACAAAWGITSGRADGTFQPGREVTRAQMATFLANTLRAAGAFLPDGAGLEFADVDRADVHAGSIAALASAGLVQGVSADRYNPNGVVTRAQMATFLMRAYEYRSSLPAPTPASPWFADAPPHDQAHGLAVSQVVELGLTAGVNDSEYRPSAPVTRGQMATFLARWANWMVANGQSASPLAPTVGMTAVAANASEQTLTSTQARESLEQLLMTMNNDARQNPTRWNAQATERARPAIQAWSDLVGPQRDWSRQQLTGDVCPFGELICHNVQPHGPGFGQVNCCWRRIGENVALHSLHGPLTPSAVERVAQSMTRGLMHSDGHRQNIMLPDWDDFGVGVSSVRHPDGYTLFSATFVFRERPLGVVPAGSRIDAWGDRWSPGLAAERIARPTSPPPPIAASPAIELSDMFTVCPFGDVAPTFTDVRGYHRHYRAIECASSAGLALGRTDGSFGPDVALNRGQAASLIVRLVERAGITLPAPRSGAFLDVPASHAHARTIGQLAELGIAAGRADGTYRPQDRVTREQFASLVDRTMAHANTSHRQLRVELDYFRDDNGSVHEQALNRLAARGVIAGPHRGLIEGSTTVTRGEAAAVSARGLDSLLRPY